jgi:RNA polymerase sigma-70 factor (ECF subfamily)
VPAPAPKPPSDPPSNPEGELALVAAIRRGDQSAWADLLTRYQDRLYSLCLRMVGNRDLAQDLAQDSMVKIIEGLSTYDGRAALSTWIYRVTMNVCLSKLRSEKYRRHASLDAETGSEDGSPKSYKSYRSYNTGEDLSSPTREPEALRSVQAQEERAGVASALLRIPADQRALLLLRDARGLEYEQIAEVLGVPVGTVKSRLFRARAALREQLEGSKPPKPDPNPKPKP